MASITAGDSEPGGRGCQKLRSMLELECQAIAASLGGSFGRGVLRRKKKGVQQDHGVLGGLLQKAGPGLQVGWGTWAQIRRGGLVNVDGSSATSPCCVHGVKGCRVGAFCALFAVGSSWQLCWPGGRDGWGCARC